MATTANEIKDLAGTEISRLFASQRANQTTVALSDCHERRAKLKRLQQAILKYRPEIKTALHSDFGKHPSEVDLTEIYPIVGELKHARRHLRRWMRPQRVSVPLAQFGSRSTIRYEPKGMALILSPWNFPVNLSLVPLVAAVAAGNTVILKPSEHTPNATEVLSRIIGHVFDEQEVAVVRGGPDTSQQLLDLPFNHIFFTGSTRVGKIVMAAAARHLASVTLELGGKSPTIVDETADVKSAARRIAWAKCVNNGQICIAPDYVFVHASQADRFIEALRDAFREFYGEDVSQEPSYCRIVNEHHFDRLLHLLDDARSHSAQVLHGGGTQSSQLFIEPTVLADVADSTQIMQEEIFGPILPVKIYHDVKQVVQAVNLRDKPLAMYIFSRSKKNIESLISQTSAGGTCVNHSGLHFFNPNLPFGGVNQSGIGKGHGRFAFEAFSNARAIYRQTLPWAAVEMMTPPYSDFKQRLIDFTIKWL